MGSSDSPVVVETTNSRSGERSQSQNSAVRESCQPSTGPSARPLRASQHTTDSR